MNEKTHSTTHQKRSFQEEVESWDSSPVQTAEEPRLPDFALPPDGPSYAGNGHAPMPFSPWPLVEMLVRNWPWLLTGACGVAGLAFLAGLGLWETRYTANAQLLRFDTPNNSAYFKPRQLSEQTFGSILRSPELMQQVSSLTKPPLSAEQLNSSLSIVPERNSDVVTVSITGRDPQKAINVANLFANEAVRFTKQWQTKEARDANVYYTNELAELEQDRAALIQGIQDSLHGGSSPSQVASHLRASLLDKLQTAREELFNLSGKYTDVHPAVIQQRAIIEQLEKQLNNLAGSGASANNSRTVPRLAPPMARRGSTNSLAASQTDSEFEVLRTQLQAMEAERSQLITRQREAQLFEKDPPGYAQLFAPATQRTVMVRSRLPKLIFLTAFGAVMGVLGSGLLLIGLELLDERLKTGDDLKRVTRLPLLGTLGNLHHMDQAAQEKWAFRTWTALQNRLSISPHHGLVCGVTSAQHQEGRSTWLSLLAHAASQCGFRVLSIGAVNGSDCASDGPLTGDGENNSDTTALTTHVLSYPALLAEKLKNKEPQPFIQIPLPGWVWDLERRKEWQTALRHWSRVEHVVILVELPPVSMPEAVLLAEDLPNLIWLSRSGAAKASECRTHLETLRNARCNLVGTVLNREPASPLTERFQRWVGCLAMALALTFCSARAAEAPDSQPASNRVSVEAVQGSGSRVQKSAGLNPEPRTPNPESSQAANDSTSGGGAGSAAAGANGTNISNRSFSVTGPDRRAGWQQHFTLGPGDILNFALFGQPDLNRSDVFIGPDGRVSYLQAQDIVAAGLTVDELRSRVDQELANFYRTPRTIITPVSYHSKKYYVLGRVANRGVYPLDRPITVVEAVARAKGLETGLLADNRNSIELADLQRSFIMRGGKRLAVNLEKLFQEGDLSQNVALEPEDYLYFAAANVQEVYVLGEVGLPGPLPWTANLTAVGAISGRGGFTQRAYKSRVLVIRGSLNHPQTFVVNVWKTNEGQALDMKLQPKDIVYVNYRPFIKAEDLLDLGITAFLQSVTVEWTGLHIDPQNR